MLDTPKAWSVKRLAAAWDVEPTEIDALIDAGKLRTFALGPKTWRMTDEEVQRVAALINGGQPLPVVCDGRQRIPMRRTSIPKAGVYFIDCGPYTKIGYTSQEFAHRIDGIKTGNPFELILWAACPGDLSLEKQFHKEFSEFRHRNEWFHFDANGRQRLKRRIASKGGRIIVRGHTATEAA